MIRDLDQANNTQADWPRVSRTVPLTQFPEAIPSLRLHMKKKEARSPNCCWWPTLNHAETQPSNQVHTQPSNQVHNQVQGREIERTWIFEVIPTDERSTNSKAHPALGFPVSCMSQ